MRCPNCGGTGAPVRGFCPYCGEKLRGRDAKPRRRAAVISLCLAAALALSLVALPMLRLTDSERFKRLHLAAAAGLIEELGDGSADITVSALSDNMLLNRYLRGTAVTLKLDLDGEDLVLNLDLALMGSRVLTGVLTLEDGVAGVWLPEARDVYYTLRAERLRELLGDYGTVDAAELFANVGAAADAVFSLASEESLTVTRGAEVEYTAAEGSFTGTLYTVVPDAGELERVISELAELMGARELTGYAPTLGRILENAGFTWSLAAEGAETRMIRLAGSDLAGGEISLTWERIDERQYLTLLVPREYLAGLAGEFTVTLDISEGSAEMPEPAGTEALDGLSDDELRGLYEELAELVGRELIDNIADSLGLLGLFVRHGN